MPAATSTPSNRRTNVELQDVNTRTTRSQDPFSTPEPAIGECRICKGEARFMCSRCGPKVHYCSQECQAKDWPEHRLTCTGMTAPRPPPNEGEGRSQPERQRAVEPVHVERSVEEAGLRQDPETRSVTGSLSRGRGVTSRSGAAQAINEREGSKWSKIFRWRKRERPAAPTEEEEPPLTEEEKIEELRFYMTNIYLIIKPVMCCIILSILWIKLTRLEEPFFGTGIDSFNDIFGGGIGAAIGGGLLLEIRRRQCLMRL
ncbi:hypothetical protein BC829DRAFT_137216 [Chytridium lagenaria]|nr:hypothetical protein BC829DRAFT_137216 [Chytridium lagenaria]